MELVQYLIDIFLHLDVHLNELAVPPRTSFRVGSAFSYVRCLARAMGIESQGDFVILRAIRPGQKTPYARRDTRSLGRCCGQEGIVTYATGGA